jgi:signal transduction histidine kinase
MNLVAIEAALGNLAARLVTARTGEEALRHLLDDEFAVILLDVRMPSLDGFETARLIRGRARTRHVPIIFMTAYSHGDVDIRRGYELGAVDYLFKPIVAEVLQAKVSVFVNLRERTEQVARQAEQLREMERAAAIRKLAEERRAWEEAALRRQMEELEQADRKKDEFLAMLAHELRNPMAPLAAHLELFRLRPIGDPRLEAARDAMVRQVGHLKRMIDDLLDVSRITRGKLELQRELLDLGEVIDRAVELCQSSLDEREIVLELDPPGAAVVVDADPVRLTQVLANLLGNACRYSEPGSRVWLRWRREGSDATIEVADQGRGISSELLDRVFEIFVQERRDGHGLGLGLTLVREIVDLHGGTVEAHSGGPGLGARFLVRLRASDVELPERREEALPPPVPHDRSLDVLIIEDDLDVRDAMSWLIEEWGHSVRTAPTGELGLEEILRLAPDVAIVDIGLPGIDGYEVAERARAALGEDGPRLIALTGYGADRDRARGERSGFDAHLAKPADPQTLMAEIAAADVRPRAPKEAG